MDRDGSSSPRHSDKSQSHTTAAVAQAAATAAAQAAACASSASAQAAHQAAQAASAQAAFNYSAFLNASVSGGGESVMLGSTENLLRNIQGLLKVAAENARQQDRQANYEKGNHFTQKEWREENLAV